MGMELFVKVIQTRVMGVGLIGLLGFFLGGLSTVSHADVYTWKDKHGQVHFGDKAPTGTTVDTIDLPKVKTTPASDVSEIERKERQRKVIESIASERKEREDARKKEKEDKAKFAAKCSKIKRRIEESKGVNLFYTRDKEGNKVYLTDKQRKAADAEVMKKYVKECG
ncbi:hypothetical protein A9Q99_14320 [Gammaproteobacteria bacterium 45_16_T64]|nr:hypothetical protein A9Q99_14320 [Gammaproteobacteria bacterium 45_16_T64]